MTRRQPAAGWRLAIDRGGTFTDIVAFDPSGRVHALKVLSRDPAHPGDPAVRGIGELLGRHAPQGARIESVRLGTTVATNALLERKGEPTLLVVTRGFRDALRIGHQHRPDIFARQIRLPPVLYAGVVEAGDCCTRCRTPRTSSVPRRLRAPPASRRSSSPTPSPRWSGCSPAATARSPMPISRLCCCDISRPSGPSSRSATAKRRCC